MIACSQFEDNQPIDSTLESNESPAAFNLSEILSTTMNAAVVAPISVNGTLGNGGNATCEDVADHLGVSFDVSGAKVDYSSGTSITNASWPGFTITITNKKYITWSYDPAQNENKCLTNVAFIVKGGPNANVYYYDDFSEITYSGNVVGDSGLRSPNNGGSNVPDLSNLTICFSTEDCTPPPPPCDNWRGETAWTAGIRYVTRGNWATYTAKSDLPDGETIFAGQHMNAGSASLSGNTLTITLNAGWRFKNASENVKIEYYNGTPPARNPNPGSFRTKYNASGSSATVTLDGSLLANATNLGIHLDVEWEDCDL